MIWQTLRNVFTPLGGIPLAQRRKRNKVAKDSIMYHKTEQSVIMRIALLMVSLISISVITMFSSVYISDMAEDDAAALNLSGSLRMQSYRLASEVSIQIELKTPFNAAEHERQLKHNINEFEATLNNQVLLSDFSNGDGSIMDLRYNSVHDQWYDNIRPLLSIDSTSADLQQLMRQIPTFVNDIDQLVMAYQQEAEKKIEWIRIIQYTALFITLILVYISLHYVQNNIAMPLRELTIMARKIGSGDFTHRVNIDAEDELGLLAQSFNHSCNAISQMYGNLEQRVEKKTAELTRSNRSIQLLYNTVKKVNHTELQGTDFDDILAELSDITGVKDIDLCLMTAQGELPYEHFMTDDDKTLADSCIEKDCSRCIGDSSFIESLPDMRKLKFPLVKEECNFGVLVCSMPPTVTLPEWQSQIIQSVADQIAVALSLKNQTEQARRISLMDERTTIARELHDSLAQALSYLKIQVTRLQKSHAKNADAAVIDEITCELKEGLSSAYRQLRELLTTFRLKIDTAGLYQALEDTVTQHRNRSDMDVALDFKLDNIPLSPNEEIHLLQIIREATQNAVHHSKGSKVVIGLHTGDDKRIHLTIKDNGIGIGNAPEKLNHYGLVIMQERSRHLQGELTIADNEDKGTCVTFSFMPTYAG